MLAPSVLRARASNVTGSREMLALTGACLYARLVIGRGQPRPAARDGPDPGPSRAALGMADRGRRAVVRRPDRARASRRSPDGCARGRACGRSAFRPGRVTRRCWAERCSSCWPPSGASRRSPACASGYLGPAPRRHSRRRSAAVPPRRSSSAGAPTSRTPPPGAMSPGRPRQRASSKTTQSSTAPDRQRRQQAGQQPPPGRHRPRRGVPVDHGRRQQRLARDLDSGGRHHHVARAGSQHVGHVEPRGPAQQARHPLLQQQRLDELALSLVGSPRDLRQPTLGQLRFDQPGAASSLRHGLLPILGDGRGAVDERQPAFRAEARLRRRRWRHSPGTPAARPAGV